MSVAVLGKLGQLARHHGKARLGLHASRLAVCDGAVAALARHATAARATDARATDARSAVTGRVVDAYTNIDSIKMFAHHDREISYAGEAIETARK